MSQFHGLASVKLRLASVRRRISRLFGRWDPALANDLKECQQRYRALQVPAGSVQDRTVLAVSLTEWLPQVKLESILAKSLSLDGFRPLSAVAKRNDRASAYRRLLGTTEQIVLK